MKLEVGMYARTKGGFIDKIISFKSTISNDYVELEDEYYANKKDILKASHNIIDLIEEKDLLEIEYFSLRYEKRVTRLFEVTFKDGEYINLGNAKCQFMLIDNDWSNGDKELKPIIKSIVTKEQFEAMKYEIK